MKKPDGKKKMQTSKKLVWLALMWVVVIQIYVMVMIDKLGDTMSLGILATTVFAQFLTAIKLYFDYNAKINLKSMEMDFNPNYDDEEGIY